MLPTEPQVINWLYANYPLLLIGLMTTSLVVYGTLKINAFLQRVENLEKELVVQKAGWVLVKMKVAKVILIHCTRHSDDMKELMKVENSEK